MTALTEVPTPTVPLMTPVTEPAWLDAARWVVKHHSFATVNKHTGERVPTPDEVYDLVEDEMSAPGRPSLKAKDLTVLDATTAHLLVKVWDSISEKHRGLFAGMNIVKAVNVAWKCVR